MPKLKYILLDKSYASKKTETVIAIYVFQIKEQLL